MPGGVSSSPVVSSATRGATVQRAVVWPMLASTPSAAGPSTAPGESRVVPARMSSPAPRMLLPSSRAGTVTTPSRSSVTSTWTTAPVPSGTTAPVEMRTAVPGSHRPVVGMAGA